MHSRILTSFQLCTPCAGGVWNAVNASTITSASRKLVRVFQVNMALKLTSPGYMDQTELPSSETKRAVLVSLRNYCMKGLNEQFVSDDARVRSLSKTKKNSRACLWWITQNWMICLWATIEWWKTNAIYFGTRLSLVPGMSGIFVSILNWYKSLLSHFSSNIGDVERRVSVLIASNLSYSTYL